MVAEMWPICKAIGDTHSEKTGSAEGRCGMTFLNGDDWEGPQG